MIINKTASNKDHYKATEYYYNSAREGLFDLLNGMTNEELIDILFLPGYIGWSPKEGSGIFDPINKLDNLSVYYYKMNNKLDIKVDDLISKINNLENRKFAVLVVNYFGFIDPNISELFSEIKKLNGWFIEDNAHGFFTSLYSNFTSADATLYSLHKMFPFKNGGSLKIRNRTLKEIRYRGKNVHEIEYNPWAYDVHEISLIRKKNYEKLDELIKHEKYFTLFEPLKDELNQGVVPQSYPIIIKRGNRDIIYQLMNDAGYGVVSLYHTLIEPLRTADYRDSAELSKCIINLPVHQDVDPRKYEEMISLLAKFCEETN